MNPKTMTPEETFLDWAMPEPAVPHQTYTYTDWYGHEHKVYTIDEEKHFPDGCLITSRTDINGIITHANEAFVEMSGWEREELIGAPHSILRHPDMPRVAFAGLWETLQRGEKWHGYVKNLRKNGGFYWVYATAIPNIRNGILEGYTSVRRKPFRGKVDECTALYAQLLAEEKSAVQH